MRRSDSAGVYFVNPGSGGQKKPSTPLLLVTLKHPQPGGHAPATQCSTNLHSRPGLEPAPPVSR